MRVTGYFSRPAREPFDGFGRCRFRGARTPALARGLHRALELVVGLEMPRPWTYNGTGAARDDSDRAQARLRNPGRPSRCR